MTKEGNNFEGIHAAIEKPADAAPELHTGKSWPARLASRGTWESAEPAA